MKNNNLKIVSIVLALLMVLSISAYAQEVENEVNISYDRLSGIITVGGNAPLAVNLDEAVRLVILKPETNVADFTAGKLTFTNVGVHVDETAISEDKTFVFSKVTFPDTMPAGDYIVLVAIENDLYEMKFSYATEKQTIDEISNVENKEEFLELIEKYNDVYGLETGDDSDYGKLSSKGKEKVVDLMINSDFKSKDDVKDSFEMFTLLSRINEGPWGVVKDIIENNNEFLGIDLDDYEKLGDGKTAVCKALIGNNAESKEEFAEIFNEAVSDEAENAENTKKPSGSSGGRGSSSSVSMQVNFSEKEPVATETPKDDQKENPYEVFGDIDNYGWAKDSIIKLYENGIVNGKAEGVFAPSDSVKRAEAAKMLVLMFAEVDDKATSSFKDVSQNSWMYPYVSAASEFGIVKGLDEDAFAPDANVSREDFAVMIYRAAIKSGFSFDIEPKEKFADDENISDYAKDAVYALKNSEIINGVGDNSFAPKQSLTRAEAAKIMAEFLK